MKEEEEDVKMMCWVMMLATESEDEWGERLMSGNGRYLCLRAAKGHDVVTLKLIAGSLTLEGDE